MAPEYKNGYKSQTVAVVLVTSNHAAVLERALESVKWANEVLVLDRGSTDQTLAIARKYTDKVFFHPVSSKAAILNDAFTRIQSDWVLFLEPFEWVEEMLRHEIDGALLNPSPTIVGFLIPQKLIFQGAAVPCGNTRQRILRLFRHGTGRAMDTPSRVEIVVTAEVDSMDRPLGCEPYANYEHLFDAINRESTLTAYEHIEAGQTGAWHTNMINLIGRSKWTFFKEYFLQTGFKEGANGLIWGVASSFREFLALLKVRTLALRKSS